MFVPCLHRPLYLYLLQALPILLSFLKYKLHAMWVAIKNNELLLSGRSRGGGQPPFTFRPN